MFCRKPKVFGASTQWLRWIDGMEARVTMWAEAKSWRWRANHHPKVVALVRHAVARHWPAKGGALM
jgi:hypothetical protein